MLCCKKYIYILVLGSQASDIVWIVGIFGEAVDEKKNNGNFTDFSVLWNGLWFFQLGQLIRDTGRWNVLPLVNCGEPVYDKKCKAKSCFIGPFLQLLVGCNSISSSSPPPKKCCPWRRTPSYFLICIYQGVSWPPSHPLQRNLSFNCFIVKT